MSFKASIYDDCCLLTNINLNPERVYHLLERRFKNNSTKTSFDFKSFLPEQPSNNAKVSRSLLRCQPKTIYINHYEDNASSDAASSSSEEDHNDVFSTNDDDDDRLNKLAEWEPEKFQSMIETDDDDDDEDENENIFQSISTENNEEENAINPMDVSSGIKFFYLQITILMIYFSFLVAEETPTDSTEDILVTYIHQPIKTEPISDNDDDDVFDNPPQLDGQIDFISSKSDPNNKKSLTDTIAKIVANKPIPNKTIQLHQIPAKPTIFRLNDDIKKKPTNQPPKRSASKIDRPKEKSKKEFKPTKKVKPRLLSSLLKTNEDTIRPLQISIPTNTQVDIEDIHSTMNKTSIFCFLQKTFRLASDSRLQTTDPKVSVQRKSLSIEERITPGKIFFYCFFSSFSLKPIL
jgi:hypothetical protein